MSHRLAKLFHAFAQESVHNHRKHNDQTVNKLGPKSSQTDSHGSSFDGANDESTEKSSQDGTSAAEHGCAAQENGGQSAQQITFTQTGPEEGNVKAGHHPCKSGYQTEQHKYPDTGATCVDTHQFGAFDVVTDQIYVGSEFVAIEQHPAENGNYDQPKHLDGEPSADLSDQSGVQERFSSVDQAAALALR